MLALYVPRSWFRRPVDPRWGLPDNPRSILDALLDPRLDGLRKWRVRDFEKFLVFYFPRSDGVSIVRVLHSAQDWWERLGIV